MASPITLKASELVNGKYFLTNNPTMTSLTIDSSTKTSDLTPITLSYNNTIISPSTTGHNLGNWCAQYFYTLNLQNDTSSEKTFNAYVKTQTIGDNYPVIMSGSSCKYAQINSSSTTYNTWRWLTKTVPANTTYTDSYQFILGTNSNHKMCQIFKLT